MLKHVAISALMLFLVANPASALLTPKLLAKFTYGHNLSSDSPQSKKIGGGLAFELELIDFFSLGIFAHASAANLTSLTLKDAATTKNLDRKTAFIDAGLYLKPQIPIGFDALTLTPYISFAFGLPSFSIIRGDLGNALKNATSISQFYSCLIGADLTFAQDWILFGEAGISTNIRFYTPYIFLVPLSLHAGIGYRF